MNKYSWHTFKERDSGDWYTCDAHVIFPGQHLSFKSYPYYKPNRKGGHTHNAFYNALNRLIFHGKNSRQFHRNKQFKKEFVATFYENMKIKENRRLIMETLNKHTRKMSGKQPLEAECHS